MVVQPLPERLARHRRLCSEPESAFDGRDTLRQIGGARRRITFAEGKVTHVRTERIGQAHPVAQGGAPRPAGFGTRTNVVTAVEVTDKRVHDSRLLEPLLARSVKRFDVQRLLADKAYSGARLLQQVESMGVQPFVPFKVHATGKAQFAPHRETWSRLFHFYMYRREQVLAHCPPPLECRNDVLYD